MSQVDQLISRALTLCLHYEQDGGVRAFRKARRAVFGAEGAARFSGTPAQLDEMGFLLGHLCLMGHQRGHAHGEALDQAELRLRPIVMNTGADAHVRASAVDVLAGVLLARYETTGRSEHLHEIRGLLKRELVVPLGRTPPPDTVLRLVNLGTITSRLARHTGDPALADVAMEQLRDALALVAEDDPVRGGLTSQIVNAQIVAAQLHGSLVGGSDTVNQVVDAARQAVRESERTAGRTKNPDVLTRAAPYLHLCNALSLRFRATNVLQDLEEAAEAADRALAAVPEGHTARPLYLLARSSVALELYRAVDTQDREGRYEEAGAQLDRAIGNLSEALTGAAAGDRVLYLSNLALAFSLRYRHDELRTEDLREAVRLAEEAVDEADGPALTAGPLQNLCLMRVLVYKQSRSPFTVALQSSEAALAAAEATFDRALEVFPGDHPALADVHGLRGRLHRAVFRVTRAEEDLDRALDAFGTAARHEPGPLLLRAAAAREGGDLASSAGHGYVRADVSAALLALAVELLEAFIEPTLLGWEDRRGQLDRFDGLAAQACAVHLDAGRPGDALAVLDRGRGMLIAPLWRLGSRADGLPAAVLARYREAVWSAHLADEAASAASQTLVPQLLAPAAPEDPVRHRSEDDPRELRREAARLLAEHAADLPPAHADPEALAAKLGTTAVVAVNLSSWRSDALVTTSFGTVPLRLPELDPDVAHDHALRLQRATTERSAESLSVMDGTVRWLWDVLAGPVMDLLAPLAPERVCWVPSGPLCMLPLHAAGHHGVGTTSGQLPETVLDRVVSSYAATLRVLQRDLGRATRPEGPALLVAPGRAGGTGRVSIPGALFREPGALRLEEHRATPPEVLRTLPGRAVAHFACHGRSVPADPTESALRLADGTSLMFTDIARTDLVSARLAFLAACETAWGGATLPDEVLHMAAAFQLAGFPHVIGTLWKVYASETATVARSVYAALADGAPPALALHRAVLGLRDAQASSAVDLGPLAWAPFVHLGV
ncbi:CHAT domain-containing protein [Streptomyces sp. NPDC058872]|uniref:CHAT domain-containing protein n=1 Tax=Streptomyces sp. NPDC058872 TaxID=3346661 RepID=UPI003684966E